MAAFEVTGSYLPTASAVNASPVTAYNTATINMTLPANVLDFFRSQSPDFFGSGNRSNEANNGGNTGGEAYLAIRNLSTLVLLDGRRVVNSAFSAGTGVDLASIPVSMIDRIDVLKDGSSTIYGTDAVGGVVNIITKKDYNGSEIRIEHGMSKDNIYKYDDVAIMTGFSNQNTYFTMVAEYYRNNTLATNQRFIGSMGPTDLTRLGSAVAPSYMSGTFYGRIGSYMLAGDPLAVGAPGYNAAIKSPTPKTNPYAAGYASVAAYAAANPGQYILINTSPASIALGGTATILNTTSYGTGTIDPTQRKQFMANFGHNIFGDKLVLFGSFLLNENKNAGVILAPGPSYPGGVDVNNMIIPATNPWNFFGQDITSFGGFTGGPVRNRFAEVGMRTLTVQSDTYRLITGLKGQINDDWSWEMGLDYSHSIYQQLQNNAINGYAFNQLVTPRIVNGAYVYNANGLPQSIVANGSGGYLSAYDYLAVPGYNDPATINALRADLFQNGNSELKEVDFVIRGTPFTVPAGKIGMAFGGEYLGQSVFNAVDTLYASGYLLGGLNPIGQFSGGATTDKAVFTEVAIPLTAPSQNLPGLYESDLNLSGRYTKLNTGANAKIPKIGIRWQPINADLTIRGTFSKGFIAPSVYSLYGPTAGNSPTVVLPDPSSSTGYNGVQITSRELSNPKLPPSNSQNFTFGFVYSPHQVRGLDISLEYYNIKQDHVGSIDYQSIFNSLNSLGSASPYASSYTNPDGTHLTTTAKNQINANNSGSIVVQSNPAGDQKTSGFDAAVSYSFELPNALGRMKVGADANYLQHFLFRATPEDKYDDYASNYTGAYAPVAAFYTLPRYNVKANLQYDIKGFAALATINYIPSVTNWGDAFGSQGNTVNGKPYNDVYVTGGAQMIPSYYTVNLTLSYTFRKGEPGSTLSYLNGLSIVVGSNNLFNHTPPFITGSPEDNTDKGTYDVIGRTYFFSLKKTF